MYSKLAIKNVKKSFKDYAIYFLTLTLAVCIFYTFNSIEAQKAIIEMQESGKIYANTLIDIMGYVSVFVSVILGGLILYANNFLIKKRKKELAIYMTLGMGKSNISRILVIETVLVGSMSLISGLLLGLIASQGLSVFSSKLFEVAMNEYSFIISGTAIFKTILYFGIMFILVMLFNTVVVSKYKIIDLLTASIKNEDIGFKHPIVYLITFVLCVVSLVGSYTLILEVGLSILDNKFILSILLGGIGTVLFFFSLSGFILFVIKRSKKVYFKGLNIFIVKQLNSKVNTNFLSMSIICLMLFFTIGILSTGISFKSSFDRGLEQSTPYDASAITYIYDEQEDISIEETLNNIGFQLNDGEEYAYFTIYKSNEKLIDMFGSGVSEKNKLALEHGKMELIKLSDYNKLRKLAHKEVISLKDDEALILTNNTMIMPGLNEFLSNNNTVSLYGNELTIKDKEIITDNLYTQGSSMMFPTLIVPDDLVEEATLDLYGLNINYPEDNKEKLEKKYSNLFNDFRVGEINSEKNNFIFGYTRQMVYEESKNLTTTILFVGIYLGLVFLITSMAVLALQQLSEASCSIDRYKAIKKIGASDKMINKSIFVQTLVYFSLPILLALVHAVVGIQVANDFIKMFNETNIVASSLITVGAMLVIYSIYFFATYLGYKNIVENTL
ncbi:MAG: FtsX-like permease family protein [Cellulosilyticaceae bacterium]